MSEESIQSVLQGGSVYPIPAAYLQGNLAEMLFWDAVFYLLAVRGETNAHGHRFVETDYAEMQTLADLSRRTLRKQLDAAAQGEEPARLWQEAGIRPYSFILKLKQYQKLFTVNKVILKPVVYMQNEWAWVLAQPYPDAAKKSRLPLAVLNVLFRKPQGQTATFPEIVSRCRCQKKPPDAAVVEKAIAHLLILDLLTKAGERQYRLNREIFSAPGRPGSRFRLKQRPLTSPPRSKK